MKKEQYLYYKKKNHDSGNNGDRGVVVRMKPMVGTLESRLKVCPYIVDTPGVRHAVTMPTDA